MQFWQKFGTDIRWKMMGNECNLVVILKNKLVIFRTFLKIIFENFEIIKLIRFYLLLGFLHFFKREESLVFLENNYSYMFHSNINN